MSHVKSGPPTMYGHQEELHLYYQTINAYLLETFKTATKVLKQYVLSSLDSIYEIHTPGRNQEAEFYQSIRYGIDDGHFIMPILLGYNEKAQTYYLPDYGETLNDLRATFTGLKMDALVLTLLATKATAPCNHPDGVMQNICLYKKHIVFNYTWSFTIDNYLIKVKWQHNGILMPIDWAPTARTSRTLKLSSSVLQNQTQEVTFSQSLYDFIRDPYQKPYSFIGTDGFIGLMLEALRRGKSVISECTLYNIENKTKKSLSILEIEPAFVSVQETNNRVSAAVTTMCAKLNKEMTQKKLDQATLHEKLKAIYNKMLLYRAPDDCVPSDTGKVYYLGGKLYAAQDISPKELITKFPTARLGNIGGSHQVVCVGSTMKVPLRLMLPFGGFGGFVRVTTKKEEANCDWRYNNLSLCLYSTKSITRGAEIVIFGEEREATRQELLASSINSVCDYLSKIHHKQGIETRSQAKKKEEEIEAQNMSDADD